MFGRVLCSSERPVGLLGLDTDQGVSYQIRLGWFGYSWPVQVVMGRSRLLWLRCLTQAVRVQLSADTKIQTRTLEKFSTAILSPT